MILCVVIQKLNQSNSKPVKISSIDRQSILKEWCTIYVERSRYCFTFDVNEFPE